MKPVELVRKFYNEIWNARNYEVAKDVLSSDLTFRGSLGMELNGIDSFIEYAEGVHNGFSFYTCEIKELVESDSNTCAARMMFSGKHTGDFLGHPPSNLQISWAGAAFFTAKQSQELPPEHLRISDIWVLGDLHNLHQQLNDAGQARPI